MQIGDVIRKYRKERHLTQEEMARRLGVTAPAVNKWERGNSYPDVLLLAPIARLLGISLDTLLSFREELTEEEITAMVREADTRLKQEPYEEVFQWAKEQMETYPNSLQLIWQLAVLLDAHCLIKGMTADAQKYNDDILTCYERVLESDEEELRTRAADSLFGYYLRREEYEKAEEYLSYYSEQNPQRKQKLALIYSRTGRVEEACKAYEELLFSNYQMSSLALHGIYLLALEEQNLDKAHRMAKKQRELAKVFEMGAYHEVSCGLELATIHQDGDAVLEIMEEMLRSVDSVTSFTESELYEHMSFQKKDSTFSEELRENLLKCFRDEETYGFLKGNEQWERLVHR